MQSLLVFTLIRKGYSGELLAKMLVNVLIDTIIGAVPIVGQITDFFFKASQRNLRLTREYLYENKHQGSGRGIWIAVVLVCLLTIFLVIYGIVALITWLISLF